MRLALVISISFWAVLAFTPQAFALTLCPITEFAVPFDENTAELDLSDREAIQAGLTLAHACGGFLDAVELVVAGDIETEGSLAARRFSAVRDSLVQNGVDPDRIHSADANGESYGSHVAPVPDAVVVLIVFNYSGPR